MATRCLAQPAGSTQSIAISSPIELPAIAMLSTLPLVSSPDDSLRQRAYRRNRVKTMTLVQLRSGSPADTVDYTELDHEGHIVRFRPAFGQSYRQRYNRQNQLVERTTYPVEGATFFTRVTYDPATKTTTTSLGPSLTQLTLWQIARHTRHGDTVVTESFFHPAAQFPTSLVRRLVLRIFRAAPDTVRIDVLVYNVLEQLLQFESHYHLGRRQSPRESGTVDFTTSPVAEARQTLSNAQRLLVASRRTRGYYLPTARFTYDAQGNLVRTFFIPLPQPSKPISSTQVSGQGTVTMTISKATDTSSVRYVRAADGQLLREEYRFSTAHFPAGGTPSSTLSFTEYTYLPNGLRKTKSGSLAARYEYRYTYY